MRTSKRGVVFSTALIVALSATIAAPAAHGETPVADRTLSTQVSDSTEKILAIGSDNIARTVETENIEHHGKYELKNKLNLQSGDIVEVSDDHQTVSLTDREGNGFGEFTAPTIVLDGRELPGKFHYDGQYLSTILSASEFPSVKIQKKGCARGTAGKWIWRGAGALTCGAAGVATLVGGAACGLAWSGAEDAMNIDDRACKSKQ